METEEKTKYSEETSWAEMLVKDLLLFYREREHDTLRLERGWGPRLHNFASFREFKHLLISAVRMQLHARSSFVLINILAPHTQDD